MSKKQHPLRKMLEDIKNQKVDITQSIKPAESKAEKLLAMIREQKVDTIYSKDPRYNLPDEKVVGSEEYQRHILLCEDLDLLEEMLPPADDWNSF